MMYYSMLSNPITVLMWHVFTLWQTVWSAFLVMYSHAREVTELKSARESARNWDKKLEKRKRKEEKTGRRAEFFKWVCRKAAWQWNRHAPSHNSRDINFSTLLFSRLPSLFSSLPLSFSPSALPLHLASSRSLTPFPPLLPFYFFPSPSSLIISLFLFTLPHLTPTE